MAGSCGRQDAEMLRRRLLLMQAVIGVIPGTLKIAPEYWLGFQDIAEADINSGRIFPIVEPPFNLKVAVINTNT